MGELPEGWGLVNFFDYVDFQEGPGIMAVDFTEYGIPLIRLVNLRKKTVTLEGCNFLSPEKVESKWSHFKLKNQDILISSSASTGIVSEVTEESEGSIAYTGIIRLRSKKESLDRDFLKIFVGSEIFTRQIDSLVTGSTIHHYGPSHLKRVTIPLPPLSIQRQIVAVLEQAEAVKRQRQEADALTGALLQSVFYEMFGDMVRNERNWDVIEFGDIICETKNGLYKTEKFQGKGTPILRMYNIYKNRIILEKYHLLTITDDEFEQYQVKPGDILFNRVNSPIWLGKSAVIPKDIGKFVFESKNIRIRVNTSKADPEYIVWYLSTPAGKEEISKRAKAAVNQSTVNNTDLREFRILLPPLSLQQQFARVVESVERIREQQVASGKEIEELCEGLMQRAFAGELIA